MKNLPIGLALCLLAGCASSDYVRMDLLSPVREGELLDVVEMTVTPSAGFTIQLRNLGPERAPGDPSLVEVRNDGQVLGRLESGQSATYLISGGRVLLKVKGLKGYTRIQGTLDEKPQ